MIANEFYGLAGKALSISETTAVQCSLAVLSEKLKSKVQFWGKLSGYQNDYLIAEVLSPEGVFGARSAFYSVDGGVNWVALPTLTSDQIDFCEQLRGRFIGQPDFLYKIRRDVPPEPEVVPELPPATAEGEENEDEDAAEEKEDGEGEGEAPPEAAPEEEAGEGEDSKVPKKQKPKFQIVSMAETFRVAHFVKIHNVSCLIVPRGAFVVKQPDAAIVRNRTFSGLDSDAATKMSSFLHVRSAPSEDLSANKAIYGPTFNITTDFLPPITEDRPEGVWSLKYDATFGVVTLENLLFEGSLFYLKTDSLQWGQVYFGTGERNLDLCFVLP